MSFLKYYIKSLTETGHARSATIRRYMEARDPAGLDAYLMTCREQRNSDWRAAAAIKLRKENEQWQRYLDNTPGMRDLYERAKKDYEKNGLSEKEKAIIVKLWHNEL